MSRKERRLGYAPSQESNLYPETDGKPMAASDEHRRVLMRTLRVLEAFFQDDPSVYISGDLLMYYVQGDPRKVVSPDVLVTFGIGQKRRRTYRVWDEGKPPDFVMELASETTYERDLTEKMDIYAGLRIPEYFLADIEALYLPTPLMGFTLAANGYQPVPEATDGSVHSAVLGLNCHLQHDDLQFYHPDTEQWLLTPEAAAEARTEQEALARQHAEDRIAQEAARAAAAEAEVAALRTQLARLKDDKPELPE